MWCTPTCGSAWGASGNGPPDRAGKRTAGGRLKVSRKMARKSAPNPNAARLFQAWSFSGEGQQVIIDTAGMHSLHPQTKEKPGRKPFKDIKVMKDDAAAVERDSEKIKQQYTRYFKV